MNPFDDPDGQYSVVVNDEGQHALWPQIGPAPAGWTVAHGPATRDSCIDYVNVNWTDMRPRSLVTHLGER